MVFSRSNISACLTYQGFNCLRGYRIQIFGQLAKDKLIFKYHITSLANHGKTNFPLI